MNYNKLVSVVMPVHNGEKYLREAIESVLNQTYKNFEFLIIENCSTDSSVEIINSFNDHRLRLINEHKCGVPHAYNRGFKEAKGEFIIVHDQDDISFPNRIESQINYLLKKQLDICGSGFVVINDKNEEIKRISPPTKNEEINEKIFFDFFAIFNPTLIIKKSVLEELGYFNTDLETGADYDFLLRSINKYLLGNNPDILLKYRYHNESTSKQNKNLWKNEFNLSVKYFNRYQPELKDAKYVLSRIYYYYGFYTKSTFYNLLSIFEKGLSLIKLKYLLYTTVFALPIYLLRKTDMFFNKRFVSFTKILSNPNK